MYSSGIKGDCYNTTSYVAVTAAPYANIDKRRQNLNSCNLIRSCYGSELENHRLDQDLQNRHGRWFQVVGHFTKDRLSAGSLTTKLLFMDMHSNFNISAARTNIRGYLGYRQGH